MKETSNVSARSAAKESLVAFAKHGKYTNLEVASTLSKDRLSDADRKLYTNLVYGVAERIPTLDYITGTLSSRNVKDIDIETLTCIRLGLYQLLYTDRIPDHAAVSETVEIAPARSKSFVNALLRSFLRNRKNYELPSETDSVEYLSVKYSCPSAMCAFLTEKLGTDCAKALLSSTLEKRLATVRVNTLKATPEDVLKSVFPDGRISPLAGDMIEVSSLFGSDMSDGRWFVQDVASRLAVSVLSPRPGETVIDVCSAPGGKSFSAAIDMRNEGRVFSFDLHENKINLIKSGAARLGIDIIEASCRDAAAPDGSLVGTADRVICDAPCSGLGVIAKKPDIKYKDPSEIERLPEVQLKILNGASRYVKPGGTLVYSTCTVNPDENGGVARRFLNENTDFSACSFELGEISAPNGMLTLYPFTHNTDGFFICLMKRAVGNDRD